MPHEKVGVCNATGFPDLTRDYRAEITAAVQAGSVEALSSIAHILLGRLEEDDERRSRAAEKKRKQREAKLSGTSRLSPDVPGRPGTIGDIPLVEHPLRSFTTPPTPARQVIAKLGDVKLQGSLDRLTAIMGDQWEDVAGFFLRRKYVTWQGWADTMLRDCGMTSQFTVGDLATVCRDDGTLDKPLGSGGVLRTFLGYARQARIGGATERGPPATNGRRPPARVMPGAQQFPTATDPDAEVKWTP